MRVVQRVQARVSNLPFHVIKFTTLVVGIPVIMYYPEYTVSMAQLNIAEAACLDLSQRRYVEALGGVVVAAAAPMLAMDKWCAVVWGLAYMMWHVGFCRRINFHGVPPVVQNVIPFVLMCAAPNSIAVYVWALGRTAAILQHQCEGICSVFAEKD